MHGGHRERVKKRFLDEGLSAFSDVQALELLLFYSIPRIDTNPLAHRLLDRFGSLSNLFEADTGNIASVEGIGENTAILIKMLPEMTRKFWINEQKTSPVLTSPEKAAEFIKPVLFGRPEEFVYVFCLDLNCRMKHYECISEGTVGEVAIYLRKVAECAMRLHAGKILLAHNHPGGHPQPSDADIKTTRAILEALAPLGVDLVDHIIFSGHQFYSFARENILEKAYPDGIKPQICREG